jgi:AcrR family transcriptional regulator
VADDRTAGASERKALLDAAMRVMMRRGGGDALVAQILKEAGLSTRAFYRHFASKDDLLCAVYRRDAESMARYIERRVAATATPRDGVEAWVRAVLSIAYDATRRRRAAVMVAAGVNAGAGIATEHRHRIAIFVAPLRAVLTAGREDGSFPLTDPEPDAVTINGMAWSVMDDFVEGATRFPLEAAVDHILRFCLPGLGAVAEPAGRRRARPAR